MAPFDIYRVQVPWADIGSALDLLERSADGSYRARPIGNRVVVDCSTETDARTLTAAFKNTRLIAGANRG